MEIPRTADRLFLFQPSKSWTYCGGATLVVGESLGDAIATANDLVAKECDDDDVGYSQTICGDKETPFVKSEQEATDHSWVFVMEFIMKSPRPVGVVFSDARYA